jgi:hypothetical protein
MDFTAFRISRTEMHHYKSEFDTISQNKDFFHSQYLENFLLKLRLSDHDIKKINNLISTDGKIKLPNFIAAMRLASLIKQGKKILSRRHVCGTKDLSSKV